MAPAPVVVVPVPVVVPEPDVAPEPTLVPASEPELAPGPVVVSEPSVGPGAVATAPPVAAPELFEPRPCAPVVFAVDALPVVAEPPPCAPVVFAVDALPVVAEVVLTVVAEVVLTAADDDVLCVEVSAPTDCVGPRGAWAPGTSARTRRTLWAGAWRLCLPAAARRVDGSLDAWRAAALARRTAETSAGVNVIAACGASRLATAVALMSPPLGTSQSVSGTSETAIRSARLGSGIDVLEAENSGIGRQASTPTAST